MEEIAQFDLSSSKWISITQLEDLYIETKSFEQFLQLGLEWITKELNRQGGAIYLSDEKIDLSSNWILYNIPDIWKFHIEDFQNTFYHSAQGVRDEDLQFIRSDLLDVAGFFPIRYHERLLGVLLLFGQPLNSEENVFCNTLLHALVRNIIAQENSLAKWVTDKRFQFMRTVANSQPINGNIDRALLNATLGIRDYFDAEYTILLLIDEESPELIISNILGQDTDWQSQINHRISPNILEILIKDQYQLDGEALDDVKSILSKMDNLEQIHIRSIVNCLLQSTEKSLLGFFIIVNPQITLDANRIILLRAATDLLANMLVNNRLFQQMKINNADAEVSRLELLNSRNTLRTLFDSIPISVYIIDASYIVKAINASRANRINSKPAELVGHKCFEGLYNRTSPCPACKVAEALHFGRHTTRIWREWISSEKFVEWEIEAHPIIEENQTIFRAIILEQDITEKRNLEANLIQSEKLAAVGQLAAGVAHEINNPLTAVIANTQILLRETPQENTDLIETLKLIETAGIRASQVVRNLLGISRKDNIDINPVDLNETINNALNLVQHELINHPIVVNIELEQNMPPVHANKNHLQGVWINLFLNAIDAMENSNQTEGILTIESHFINKVFQVTVSDNGIGIEPGKIQHIFEPFFTTKSSNRGTGLGLSVCLRIIKQHQGNIYVESQLGQGSRFIVTLPFQENQDTDQ